MLISQPGHAKTGLLILVIVVPKEEPFFWYDIDYRIVLCHVHRLHFIDGVIPKEGFVPAKPSFGITTTEILRPVSGRCGSHACIKMESSLLHT